MVDETRNVKLTGLQGYFGWGPLAIASGFLRDTVLRCYAIQATGASNICMHNNWIQSSSYLIMLGSVVQAHP
jgi:hypothetical protein